MKLRRSLYARPESFRGQQCTRGCVSCRQCRRGSRERVPQRAASVADQAANRSRRSSPKRGRAITLSDLLAIRWQTAVQSRPGMREAGVGPGLSCWFGVEPPAGIEPATPSLPWIGHSAPCSLAFSQLVSFRKCHSYGATSAELVVADSRAELRFLGTGRDHSPRQPMAPACAGQRLRTALLTKAVASMVVGRASDCTSRWITRRPPRPSMPRPSHTTFPSRNSSSSEAAARSLEPKVIALASATKRPGPVVVVVTSAVLSLFSWLHPAPGSATTPSRATYFISHRTTARILAPLAALSLFSVNEPSIVTVIFT